VSLLTYVRARVGALLGRAKSPILPASVPEERTIDPYRQQGPGVPSPPPQPCQRGQPGIGAVGGCVCDACRLLWDATLGEPKPLPDPPHRPDYVHLHLRLSEYPWCSCRLPRVEATRIPGPGRTQHE
jgi:hypothetical protein